MTWQGKEPMRSADLVFLECLHEMNDANMCQWMGHHWSVNGRYTKPIADLVNSENKTSMNLNQTTTKW